MNIIIGTSDGKYGEMAEVYDFETQTVNLKVVERPRTSHPYNYSEFVFWKSEIDPKEIDGSLYTDRLSQWDYDKMRKLQKKHFGNSGDYWTSFKPEEIEKFLCDWLDKEVKLVLMLEYCNVSNGYPLWQLMWKNV